MIKLSTLLIESNSEIFNKDLVKAIENWVFKNDKKYINDIVKYNSKTPDMFKKGGVYYRAMILPQETIDDIKNGKSFKLKNYSSWTDTYDKAVAFITKSNKSTTNNKGIKVIFKKKISDKNVLLNISAFITYMYSSFMLDDYNFDELTSEMAIEEGEVIVSKKLVINKKDLYKTLK